MERYNALDAELATTTAQLPIKRLITNQLLTKVKGRSAKFAAVFVAIGLSACAPPSQNSSSNLSSLSDEAGIVNGQTVGGSDPIAQSTVGLVFEVSQDTPHGTVTGTSLCTGSLVSANVVLTAAHCLEGVQRGAVIFSLNVESGTASDARGIDKVIVHPKASLGAPNNNWNDLALVRFTGGLPNGYSPISHVLTSVKLLSNGMNVILAGYGATGMGLTSANAGKFLRSLRPSGPGPSPTPSAPSENSRQPQAIGTAILRKVDVELTQAAFSQTELMFNMSANGGGACHGDSGGPAFAMLGNQLTLIGVTSRSATPAGGLTCKDGSIYTNVGAFGSFIQASIRKMGSTNITK